MTRNEARTETGLDPVDEWADEDIAPPQIPPQLAVPGNNGNQQEDEAQDELRAWRKWALKRINSSGFYREFEVNHVPPAKAGAIAGALESAKTTDDVIKIFDDAWLGYP